VVSLDGSSLAVADEAANVEAFGYPPTGQGRTGYPQLTFTALVENATHALFGVASGGFKDSEVSLAHQSIGKLRPDMLCLADRGLSGYPLWQAAAATGAQLLWRIPKSRRLPVLERLADGSYLSQIEPAPRSAALMRAKALSPSSTSSAPIRVRVIDYRMPGVPGGEGLYRLMSTLLVPEQASAQALATLYAERWGIETTLAELKSTLKGADIVLRSKTPALVRQEFYGLVLAHYAVRKLMYEAALTRPMARPITPERLSFRQALNTVRRKLPAYGAIPP
jgi:hypothetical protein